MSEPRLLGDRYELGEVLGRGGMAEVRRGLDRRLGRVVAIKMLRVDYAGDATFQARFRREAQSAASLNHRSIVAVYDTGEDYLDGHRVPYIVMEYVEGHTLRDMLREQARFTPERTLEITAGILDALEYSHRAGIVHRDIKPGNVMITESGEVKVMDFGIARSLADTGAALTQTAAVVGTAQYISPEQARGESADARSDLYATGCVLYEMLTGRPPFVGDSLVSVAVSHVRELPTAPSALDPSIPRDLDAIVMKALAKDRLDRYQSAYEMRADIERCAAGLPVAAAADATAATQFIGAGAYGEPYEPTSTYNEVDEYGEEEEPERRGMSWGALIAAALAVLAVAAVIGYLAFRDSGVQQATVPEVVGQSLEDAIERIEDRGLVVAQPVEEQVVEEEDRVGTVLEQDPPPNEVVEAGTEVNLVVGIAPDLVAVPSVEGRTLEEATALIEEADLQVGEVTMEETTNEDEQGIVLSQDPPAEQEIAPNGAVNLVVGQAPDETTVPNLLGLTEAQARDELERADLVLGSVTSRPSSEPEDTVIDSSPPRGESLSPGSRVDIVLSAGEETENVAPVATLQEGQAQSILEQQGFEVEVDRQPTCEVVEGTVLGQNPSAGTEATIGSTVTITVAEEPPGGCNADDGEDEDDDNGNGNGDNNNNGNG